MNTQSALVILERVEELVDAAKAVIQETDKEKFWQRDKAFIFAIRDCLVTNDLERIRWASSQMRNLSQGFGSYCNDMEQLDGLLNELYCELEKLKFSR